MPSDDVPPIAIFQPAQPAAVAEPFDLARVKPTKAECGKPAADGAIVVCAVNREKFRVHPLTGPFANQALPIAQVQLAPGVSAQAQAEQRGLAGGASGPAAMVRLKIGF